MPTMKASGGLNHGRRMFNASISRCVNAVVVCSTVSSAVEILASVTSTSSEKHIDLEQSQQKHDQTIYILVAICSSAGNIPNVNL